MKRKDLHIETIHQCNCWLGSKTLHPLVCAIDLSKANLKEYSIKLNFYTILLVENKCDEFFYGRKYYDYSNATMVFLSPGQCLQTDDNQPFLQKGWLLTFHPHLLHGTALGKTIGNYTFFTYWKEEALHLSLREKDKIVECINNIVQELQHAIDRYSKTLISRYIELLLDYCSRFYERQFITRNEVNNQILNKTDSLLDMYQQSCKSQDKDIPSAAYCANLLNLSPCYFRDLLKFETGKTIDQYYQLRRIETAKKAKNICSHN